MHLSQTSTDLHPKQQPERQVLWPPSLRCINLPLGVFSFATVYTGTLSLFSLAAQVLSLRITLLSTLPSSLLLHSQFSYLHKVFPFAHFPPLLKSFRYSAVTNWELSFAAQPTLLSSQSPPFFFALALLFFAISLLF